MAIDNTVIIIATCMAFTYLVLYKKNHLFGNIAFASTGLAILAYANTNTINAIGIIILLGSLINAIYDTLTTTKS